jgi:tetratricopeptide (TPR) repeat protein
VAEIDRTRGASPSRRVTIAHLLVLSAATIALYARGLFNGFVTDDESEVLQDHFIRGFSSLPRLFSTNVWFFAGVKVDNYYRPFKLVAYMLEYHLFGFRPFFWHLASVLFGAAVVLAIYFLVRDLASRNLAFWTALFFAFHPAHVEAVAWISGGSDVLCGLSLLLSLWFYHRARSGQKTGLSLSYGLSVALLFAALLFKETALTFPAIILAYDFLYRKQSLPEMARSWSRYVAYFAVLGAYLAMRIHALAGFAPTVSGMALSWVQMIWSVPVLAVKYIWLFLVPIHLNYWHVYEPVLSFGWRPAAAMVFCLLLVWAMFRLRQREPLLSLALAWFWLTLIPALDIPKVSDNVFAERYLYVPSFGFCIFVAWCWLWLLSRAPRPAVHKLAYTLPAVLLVFYGVVVFNRLPAWRNTFTLLETTAQQSPNSSYVMGALSVVYLQQGQMAQALYYAQRALADDPTISYVHNNLAQIFLSEGHPRQALAEAKRAVELQPNFPPFFLNLGAAYNAVGDWNGAAEACRRGLALDPSDPTLLDQLGVALIGQGHVRQAVTSWLHALRIDPADAEARINLATALYQGNQFDAAALQLEAALRLAPKSPYAYLIHYKLGLIDEKESQWQLAANEYREALSLRPAFRAADARLNALNQLNQRRASPEQRGLSHR